MTMENIFQKPSPREMPIKYSQIRKCAVELTGRNSVTPSTIPSSKASRYEFKKPPS